MNTPHLELISHRLCPYVQRARIVLAEKSIPHQIRFIDLANKPDWFVALSPLGKVPVLLVDGQPLFESAVIAEFLDDISSGSLLPADALARARNRSWIEFASSTLSLVANWYSAAEESSFRQASDGLRQRFERLEHELGEGPFFNGSSFSLVDAAVAPVFRYFEVVEQRLDLELFCELPRVQAWRRALRQRTSVKAAVLPEYPELLLAFLAARESVLGRALRQCAQVQLMRAAG